MIKTKRFGVNYKNGEGQTVEVIINDGAMIYDYTAGLSFDEALELCERLEKNESIGRDQKYKKRVMGGGFLYVGTIGKIERYHGDEVIFVSDTGARENLPFYALEKI